MFRISSSLLLKRKGRNTKTWDKTDCLSWRHELFLSSGPRDVSKQIKRGRKGLISFSLNEKEDRKRRPTAFFKQNKKTVGLSFNLSSSSVTRNHMIFFLFSFSPVFHHDWYILSVATSFPLSQEIRKSLWLPNDRWEGEVLQDPKSFSSVCGFHILLQSKIIFTTDLVIRFVLEEVNIPFCFWTCHSWSCFLFPKKSI